MCVDASSTSARCSSRQQLADEIDLVAQPEAHVGRDLVVARAPGVQALAGVAGERDEARLDVEVHVLEVDAPDELAALDLARVIVARPRADRGEIVGADDAAVGEHRRMREAAGDVGAPEPLVETDARRVALHELARRLGEQRRPGFGFFLELVRGHGR